MEAAPVRPGIPGRTQAGMNSRSLPGAMRLRALAPTLTVLVVLGCGGGTDSAGGDAAQSQSIPTEMLGEGGTQQLPPAMDVPLAELGFDQGRDEAPIKIVEFSDFGCGYCRRFHTEIFPALEERWIDGGQVQWKYVTYVSGMFPNGLQAAFAAECTGEQDRFEPMRTILYERQQEWKNDGNPYAIFEGYADQIGVDMDDYRACLSQERRRGRVRSGVIAGARLGVRGTPSFLVDGYPLVGAQPVEVWNEILESRLAELEGAGEP